MDMCILHLSEGKADEGYLVGYASNSKAYRAYNLTNKRVEETMNLRFLEDKPNVQGIGHEWYFDLDYLTDSLGYTRFKTDTTAGTQETNINAGTQDLDSDSEVDEHIMQKSLQLQRHEYEAKDAAAKICYEPAALGEPALPLYLVFCYDFNLYKLMRLHFLLDKSQLHLSHLPLNYDDFRATLSNLAPAGEKPPSIAKALEDPIGLDGYARKMQQFHQPASNGNLVLLYGEIEEEVYVTQPKALKSPTSQRIIQSGLKLCMDFIKPSRPGYQGYTSLPYTVDDIILGQPIKPGVKTLSGASRPEHKCLADSAFVPDHQVTPLTSHLNAIKKNFKKSNLQVDFNFWAVTLISWQCKKHTIEATLTLTEACMVAAASSCAQVDMLFCGITIFSMIAVSIMLLVYNFLLDRLVTCCRTIVLLVVSFRGRRWFFCGRTMNSAGSYSFLKPGMLLKGVCSAVYMISGAVAMTLSAVCNIFMLLEFDYAAMTSIHCCCTGLCWAQLQLDDANGIFDMQIDDILEGMGVIGYPTGPVNLGPHPPRPDNYISLKEIDNLVSMEDDTNLGEFHEDSPAGS
ncbi:hypothetical protein Tco_1039734 [Tanacetum coccineum]